MPEMPRPSRELAVRLTSDLGYDGRINGMELNTTVGTIDSYLYSLKEVALFLCGDSEGITQGIGFVRFIDPDDLREWVRSTLGDAELDRALAKIAGEYEACEDSVERYIKKVAAIPPIKELLLLRLKQGEEVMGEAAAQGGKREG